MMRRAKRVFIDEYIGLCNRLETLNLALAIERAHGHQVWLDWPELDGLSIAGVRAGKPGPIERFRALRVRKCSLDAFVALADVRTILLRTYLGPESLVASHYAEAIGRIGIQRWVADELNSIFGALAARPVIGVHIRRGDFPLDPSDQFDAGRDHHPAVPLWWYQHVMRTLLRRNPETAFFVSYSGHGEELATLRAEFDVVVARTPDPHMTRGSGHAAQFHPVVDLFGLACCQTILATPLSSFSHYAAHLLGPVSACLVPALRTTRAAPEVCLLDARGRRHDEWTAWSRSGEHRRPLDASLSGVPLVPASLDWLLERSGSR